MNRTLNRELTEAEDLIDTADYYLRIYNRYIRDDHRQAILNLKKLNMTFWSVKQRTFKIMKILTDLHARKTDLLESITQIRSALATTYEVSFLQDVQ